MRSAPNARDKIKVVDVVVSTTHVTFLTNMFPRLISLPMSAIFISRTSGITAISKYRSVNPIDSIHRGKMEQILLACGLLKETVLTIRMLYKNTKVMVCSPDGDTDFFAPYLFTLCQDYVLRTSIDLIRMVSH